MYGIVVIDSYQERIIVGSSMDWMTIYLGWISLENCSFFSSLIFRFFQLLRRFSRCSSLPQHWLSPPLFLWSSPPLYLSLRTNRSKHAHHQTFPLPPPQRLSWLDSPWPHRVPRPATVVISSRTGSPSLVPAIPVRLSSSVMVPMS